jgi:superoxide dismutase
MTVIRKRRHECSLPGLGYSYEALAPCIDAETIRLHHDKHHESYVELLNKAIADYPQFDNTTIEDLLEHLNGVPEEICAEVRNTGGGHANHQLLWKVIGPPNSANPMACLRRRSARFRDVREPSGQINRRSNKSIWFGMGVSRDRSPEPKDRDYELA